MPYRTFADPTSKEMAQLAKTRSYKNLLANIEDRANNGQCKYTINYLNQINRDKLEKLGYTFFYGSFSNLLVCWCDCPKP